MTESPETIRQESSTRRSLWVPVGLFCALLLLYAISSRPSSGMAHWETDVDAALASAAETDRMVLVAFYMPGCGWCDIMDETVLTAEPVRRALADYVPVRVNVEVQRDLSNRMGVYGTPTYAVLDPDGGVRAVTEGYQPVEEFVRFLKRAPSVAPRQPSPAEPSPSDAP